MYVYKGVSVLIPGGLFITSEPREDHIHFLVFTDVCGNRTYGVVAQYYQPMQVCYLTHAFTEIYLKVMSGVFFENSYQIIFVNRNTEQIKFYNAVVI